MTGPDTHIADADLVLLMHDEALHVRRLAMERHLSGCATCRTRRDALAALSARVDRLVHSEPGNAADSQASARMRLRLALAATTAEPARYPASHAWRLWWTAAAASLVAALLLFRPGGMTLLTRAATVAPEADALPIAALTPGAATSITARELCAGVRHTTPISDALRTQVLRQYGMEQVPPELYELDYLITPELGGATDARNLWPQRYAARRWNAKVKDQLEDLLPRLVCEGRLDLRTAQRDMSTDWVAAYRRHFRTDEPVIQSAAGSDWPTLVIPRPNRENRPTCLPHSGLPPRSLPSGPRCGA